MDVKCKDIHYSIGEKKILNGVSLKVEGGQFQTILGPNGSGKSTLLKTIYRQLKPDSGQILLDGGHGHYRLTGLMSSSNPPWPFPNREPHKVIAASLVE